MAGTNNSSHATGGSSNVNVNTEGGRDANLLQAILSFAMDVPRVVRSTSTVWGVVLLLTILVVNGVVYWNLNSTMEELKSQNERIKSSLVNMNDKYNRVIRYVKTGDPSNFSKTAQED